MKKKVLLCCFLPALILSFAIWPNGKVFCHIETAVNSKGESVDVWDEKVDCDIHIFAQRYDAARNPVGEKLWVSETGLQYNEKQLVAIDDFGNFVVVWDGDNPYSSSGEYRTISNLYMRVYDALNNPSDICRVTNNNEWLHVVTSSSLNGLAITPLSGRFVICWYEYEATLENIHLWTQQFGPDGNPLNEAHRLTDSSLERGPRGLWGTITKLSATEQGVTIIYRKNFREPLEQCQVIVIEEWGETIQPAVKAISYQQGENPGGVLTLTISPTTAGKEYQVYYCDQLQENYWLPLGEPVKASGTQVTVIDDGGISSVPLSQVKSRFYKVKIP